MEIQKMEEPTSNPNSSSDLFSDSYDCSNLKAQKEEEEHDEEEGRGGGGEGEAAEPIKSSRSLDSIDQCPPLPSSLRRRRSSSRSASISQKQERRSTLVSKNNNQEEEAASSNSTLTFCHNIPEPSISTISDAQTVTSPPRNETLFNNNNNNNNNNNDGSFLLSIAGIVIKAVVFQLNFLVSCFTLPAKMMYLSFLIVHDPFGTIRNSVNFAKDRVLWVWNGFNQRLCPVALDKKLVVRLAFGCFWSAYVGFVLFGLLIAAFLGGNLLVKSVLEEPVKMVRELNFDYTKPSPDALVPIDSSAVGCSFDWIGKEEVERKLGGRVVPRDRRLKLLISLNMPESDYNRKLGMFQVRAEFLSANGQITYSSSKPCMMLFKSPHIRLLGSVFKTGTLLAGYSSESQILKIKMTGFVEGNKPTACVRVIIEQRAEYRHGAGIPEIYAASIELESQLPLLKSIIWSMRKTIYIWVAMVLFFLEVSFVFICCRPVIMLRSSSETPRRT